jgi:YVTN family beta-propeller protein
VQGSDDGDARGVAFSPDGNRMFMVGRPTRVTGQIQVFDTSVDESGMPKNAAIGQVEICSAPSEIGLYDPGDGLRLYVPCFGNGQVWVINAAGLNVEATIDVGIGPSSIAIATSRRQAYVGNYGEDTITVVDLDRNSPTYHYGVLRLGQKRQ